MTAPASVRANQTFAVQHRVHLPVMDDVPIALIGFGFRSTLTIPASTGPGGPRVLTQAPVDVPLGGNVAPETFSVPVTAGPGGAGLARRCCRSRPRPAPAAADTRSAAGG